MLGEIFKGVNIRDNLGQAVENQINFHKEVVEGAEMAAQAAALAEAQAKAAAEVKHPVVAESETPISVAAAAPVVVAHAPRVVINEKAQKDLHQVGILLASEVGRHIEARGMGSQQQLKQWTKLFCKKVTQTHCEAVINDEVIPPQSLEVLMGLYHIDYHGNASEVLPAFCEALGNGLPNIDDHN